MEKNIDTANTLIGEKKFREALEILASLDKNVEVTKLMGLCNLNLDNFTSARENFENVVKISKDDATSWFYLAICYDNLDDFQNAIQAYKTVISLRDKYIEAYQNLGVMYLKAREESNALDLAKKALEFAPDNYLFYYLAGSALLAMRDYQQSIEYFEKAVSINDKNPQLFCNYGTAFLSCQKYEDALKMYDKAIKINNKLSIAYYNKASVYQIQGKMAEAIKNFKKAFDLDNSEFFLSALALAEFKSEKFEDAEKSYHKLVSAYPDKQNYRYNLVCCYEKLGNIKSAIEILEQLVAFNPKSKLMTLKLAGILVNDNQFDKAKHLYETLISNGNVSDYIYYCYAMVCIKTGDFDISERILKKVLELNPNYAKARKDLGVIFLNKRLFDYADEEFQKAYEISPNDPEIVFEYANYLQAVHKNEEAKPLYDKAIELDAKNPKVFIFAALNAQIINDLQSAVKYVEAAVKLIPNDPFILLNAGKIYYAAKKYSRAKFILIKSLEINQNVEVENMLGLTYLAKKEYDKALNVFEKLFKQFPTNTNIMLSYAKTLEKLGKNNEAKDIANRILDIFDDMPEAKKLIKRIDKIEKKV